MKRTAKEQRELQELIENDGEIKPLSQEQSFVPGIMEALYHDHTEEHFNKMGLTHTLLSIKVTHPNQKDGHICDEAYWRKTKASSINLRHSALKKLLENDTFIAHPELELTAYLIDWGMNNPKEVAKICPAYPVHKLYHYQSRINKEIDKKYGALFSELKMALELLTPKQKQAVKRVYLKNEDRKTKIQIASELNISIDSLNDRLQGAFKKLKAAMPIMSEYFAQKRHRDDVI